MSFKDLPIDCILEIVRYLNYFDCIATPFIGLRDDITRNILLKEIVWNNKNDNRGLRRTYGKLIMQDVPFGMKMSKEIPKGTRGNVRAYMYKYEDEFLRRFDNHPHINILDSMHANIERMMIHIGNFNIIFYKMQKGIKNSIDIFSRGIKEDMDTLSSKLKMNLKNLGNNIK